MKMEDNELPPDEQRCTQTNGNEWRCKNFRIGLGDDDNLPMSKHCKKHYNCRIKAYQILLKKRSGGAASSAATGRGSKRRRKMVAQEDDWSLYVTGGIQAPSTDAIIEGGTTANIRRKRENIERIEGSGKLESLTRTWEPVVKSKSSLEYYKSKCCELSLELEKKKIECTKLQRELAEVIQTRKTAATEEAERTPADATDQYWRKMYFDLESRVLRIENGNSTIAECVGSRISKLESLALRSGREHSILRFENLRDFVKIKSEAWGLQNDVTGEKQGDETSCGGKEYSHVSYELKTKEKVLNMYEEVGVFGGRLSEHGSPAQDHLEMSKKPFANLVSDDDCGESLSEFEDSDCSSDSNTSLGSLMDMLAMKYRNRNGDEEIKWKFEADMLSSFEEDPELTMKAVCALYRQHRADVEISAKGLFHYSDVLSATALAKFLMDGACKGDLKKSVEELEKFDPKGVEDCKRLARSYSKQLFSIYQRRKDPYFLSATTASQICSK